MCGHGWTLCRVAGLSTVQFGFRSNRAINPGHPEHIGGAGDVDHRLFKHQRGQTQHYIW